MNTVSQRGILFPKQHIEQGEHSRVRHHNVHMHEPLHPLACWLWVSRDVYRSASPHPPGRRCLIQPCQETVPCHSALTVLLWFVLTSAILQSNALTARLQRGLSGIMVLIEFVPFYKVLKLLWARWWQRRKGRKYRWLIFRSLTVGLLQNSLHI